MYLISSWVECFYTNGPIDFSRTIYLNNIYYYIITKIHLEYFYLLQRQLFEGVFDYLDLYLDCNVGRIIMQLDCGNQEVVAISSLHFSCFLPSLYFSIIENHRGSRPLISQGQFLMLGWFSLCSFLPCSTRPVASALSIILFDIISIFSGVRWLYNEEDIISLAPTSLKTSIGDTFHLRILLLLTVGQSLDKNDQTKKSQCSRKLTTFF